MAGGIWKKSQAKVRPGVYVNLKNGRQKKKNSSLRGVAAIPLIGYDWGPRGEFIKISAESPDAHVAELGRSIADDHTHMLMLKLMLEKATTVYAYIPDGGTKATKTQVIDEYDDFDDDDVTTITVSMTVTAKYKGSLGNKIKLVCVKNPVGGYDVSVYVGTEEVELFEKVAKIEDLAGVSKYVDITGTGDLHQFASLTLEGGTDAGTVNAGVSAFLDKIEKLRFNCLAFPITDAALQAALLSKIKYIREVIGWKCQAVAPNFAADYEGIINLVNAFTYEGTELTVQQATAWLAGATAGATYTESLTYAAVDGASAVVGELTNEAAINAIQAGQTFFSVAEDGSIILEYDINSLVNVTDDKGADANKNRVLRVYDNWCNECLMTFIPGKYSNDSDGWAVMEGIGKGMLLKYQEDGAITNVNVESDFLVDRELSVGDSTYINAGLQAVDSADKYYIETITR